MTSKDAKQLQVLAAVAKIIHTLGVSGVNPSRVSRAAGVSRGWIYKYMTPDRDKLIQMTVRHFVTLFVDLKPAQLKISREEFHRQLEVGFADLLTQTRAYPEVLSIYFYASSQKGPLGNVIRKQLNQHLDRESSEVAAIFGVSLVQARQVSAELAAARSGFAHSALWGDLATLGGDHAFRAAQEAFTRTLRAHPLLA